MEKREESIGQQPGAARTPLTRHNYQSLIDQRIAQAQEDGLFDNLPGQGKPLKLDDDALVPEEERLAYRMLKSNGFAPPWIEARREIEEQRAQLAAWLAGANQRWPHLDARGRAALQVAYRRKLDELQGKILNFNLKVPRGVDQLAALRVPDELQKLGA